MNTPFVKGRAEDAYVYAALTIKERFPEGEPVIATSPRYAFYYAEYPLRGRFPLAEELILKSPYKASYLHLYSINELAEYFEISDNDLLILKLRYTDKELKDYLIRENNDATQ